MPSPRVNNVYHARGFTLLELLVTMAIIAVLTTFVVFFTVGYIAYAQQNADKQTLTVLNDALTRYKCEGGDITALTSGAPTGHVLAKLANTINWNGYVHQVLQKGVTYPSRSLQGAGYHQSYQFAKFNSYGTPVAPGQDILDRLASQGTPADATTSAWVANALTTTGSSNYLVLSNPTDRIGFNSIRATGTVAINWGDGSTNTYTPGGGQTISHSYGSTDSRGVVIVGNVTYIYSNYNDGSTAFGGDVSTMPCITVINIWGTNTLSGSISGLTGLTYLLATGTNTLSGSVTGLTALTNINVYGSNTLSGSVTGLTGLTSLSVTGSNTLSGSVTGLTALTNINVSGSNTLSGSVAGITGLTSLLVQGSNTLSGSVTGITGLTNLLVTGSNSCTGSVAGMTGLQYLFQGGGSTFDYSAVNWNSMPSLSYVYVKGMTQPQVDALLAGMWANKDASKPYNNTTRIITCTSGCAAPSAAGYITKANLQAYATPGNNYPTYSYWTVNTN